MILLCIGGNPGAEKFIRDAISFTMATEGEGDNRG